MRGIPRPSAITRLLLIMAKRLIVPGHHAQQYASLLFRCVGYLIPFAASNEVTDNVTYMSVTLPPRHAHNLIVKDTIDGTPYIPVSCFKDDVLIHVFAKQDGVRTADDIKPNL